MDKLWLFIDILIVLFLLIIFSIYFLSVYRRVRESPKAEKPESEPMIINEMSKN